MLLTAMEKKEDFQVINDSCVEDDMYDISWPLCHHPENEFTECDII